LAHASSNASQRETRRAKPQIDYFNPIARALPRSQSSNVRQAAERRFEREIRAHFGQTVYLSQHRTGRCDGGKFWSQWRQAASDQVSVDEVHYSRDARQILTREGRLAGPVRARNDDATRLSLALWHAKL
jgi:hypothetical protein